MNDKRSSPGKRAEVGSTEAVNRRAALEQAEGLASKFVKERVQREDERDEDARKSYGPRLRVKDMNRIREIGIQECGSDYRPRSVQSLLDEAVEYLFLSRELHLESLGLKPVPGAHRQAMLKILSEAPKKKAK